MENSELQTKIPKYTCPYCGQKFIRISNLKIHITKKHFQYGFYCPYCNESFKNLASLRYHLWSNIDDYHQNLYHLLTKRHSKFIDKKLLMKQNNLQIQPQNVEEKTLQQSKSGYKCPLCGHISKTMNFLYWHIMLIHDTTFIKCPYCEYIAINLSDLRNHAQSQTDEKHLNFYKLLSRNYYEYSVKKQFMIK